MTATMKLRATVGGQKTAAMRPCLRPRSSRSACATQAVKDVGLNKQTQFSVPPPQELIRGKTETLTVGLCTAACFLPQVASAAQEVFTVAEGEPLIVQAGWAALAVSFTMSIAIVVWGRSGL